MKTRILIIILIIFLIGCENYTESSISFQTIDKGILSGIQKKSNYIINNNKEFSELWNNINNYKIPKSEVPKIDFEKEIVIAVFQGQKNTGGYDIEITNIMENNKINVYIKETEPKPNNFVIQALTSPYHIIKINKPNKYVKFILV